MRGDPGLEILHNRLLKNPCWLRCCKKFKPSSMTKYASALTFFAPCQQFFSTACGFGLYQQSDNCVLKKTCPAVRTATVTEPWNNMCLGSGEQDSRTAETKCFNVPADSIHSIPPDFVASPSRLPPNFAGHALVPIQLHTTRQDLRMIRQFFSATGRTAATVISLPAPYDCHFYPALMIGTIHADMDVQQRAKN